MMLQLQGSNVPPQTTLDGLPKQFVAAMRTLFDIMDDKNVGYVSFKEIENRWHDDGTKGLPKGVLDSLQKVTPSSGFLSFERFCAGLKICLLRNQAEVTRPKSSEARAPPVRPPSAPLLDVEPNSQLQFSSWANNISRPQHRATSMPQLAQEPREVDGRVYTQVPNESKVGNTSGNLIVLSNSGGSKTQLCGPPKPPRTAAGLLAARDSYSGVERGGGLERGVLDRAEIRSALQSWQQRATQPPWNGRGLGDGKPSLNQGLPNMIKGDSDIGSVVTQKRNTGRRREPRRHTLQNGIDYNMLKRMKQMEQEKDVLLEGLHAVERARDWYLKQLATVSDKMKYLGRMGSHMEPWSEAQQERIQLQRARVLEVNRHLEALTDGGERGGFPLQLNLAVQGLPDAQHARQQAATLQRLRHQNILLTEDVNKKNERLTNLEREKASLIRELYALRRPSHPVEEPGFV